MVKKITIVAALLPFLTRPREKLHLSAIAKEVREPRPTVRLWLNGLEKEGILKKSSQGRLSLYALNEGSPALLDYLAIAQKLKLLMAGEANEVMREFASSIQQTLEEGSKALIFGSAAEEFQTANDVDVLIAGRGDANGIRERGKTLGKETHIIQVKTLAKVSPALRSEVIKKHILINGTEEFVRW